MRNVLACLVGVFVAGGIATAQIVPGGVSEAAHDIDDAAAAFHAYVNTTYPSNAALVLGAKNVADGADALHTTVHDVNNNQAPVSQIPCDHNALYRAITRMPALETVRNDPVVNRSWREIARLFGTITRGLISANLSYILPRVPAHGIDTGATALDAYLQTNYTGSQYQSLLAASVAFQAEADSFHDFYHDLENCRNNRTIGEIPAEYARLAGTAATLLVELLQSGVWASDASARSMTVAIAVDFMKLTATLRAYRYI